MTKTLTLFPDTNLFIQCKSLQEIDWSSIGDFAVIDLVVTRPVQAEIDRQKGKGSGRVANRARTAASLFGAALDLPNNTSIIRVGPPEVRLVLRIQDRPSKTLTEQLNYDERDDQLVGIAAAFREANPSADIRVITHDIGPRASSKAVGVPCEQVPENWLLAPETDESEKRVKAIQAELDRFKASEPSISFELDGASKGAKDVTGDYVVFPALSEDEIGAAMRALRVRFPACSDFASQEPKKTASGGSAKSGLFDIANFTFEPGRVFTPASKVEIAQYKDEDYPGWVRNCEKVLRSLHSRMQIQMPRTSLTIRLSNSGSRPAENALVTFVARGTFRIQPPARDDEDAPPRPAFERPPSPPTGRWSSPLDNLWGTVASARVVPSMFDTPTLWVTYDACAMRKPSIGARRDHPCQSSNSALSVCGGGTKSIHIDSKLNSAAMSH